MRIEPQPLDESVCRAVRTLPFGLTVLLAVSVLAASAHAASAHVASTHATFSHATSAHAASVLAAPHSGVDASSDSYLTHRALGEALKALGGSHPKLIDVKSIASSPGGREVWVARLGAGERVDDRPAVLLVANAHGPHLIGGEIALRVARDLAGAYGRDTAVTRLLDRTTLYVIPRANPDAAEAFFGRPLTERVRNGAGADDDGDGAVDEDGPDDLNGDGLITQMRVADPEGEWVPDSTDAELLRRASPARGEIGRYKLYVEGRDDDHDERWNEDPPGGTDVGSNFSYQYPYFAPGSGDHPMSAPEARAIAQFIVDHPNVALIYVLGPQDNVIETWEAKAPEKLPPSDDDDDGPPAQPPLTAMLPADKPWLDELAKRYRFATGAEKAPPSAKLEGDPLSWAYYHMGRWAVGSRVWWPAPDVPDTSAKPVGGKGHEAKKGDEDPIADERTALHWARRHVPGAFAAWAPVTLAEFPGHRVEVGGFAPYARVNPPIALADSLARGQGAFVRELLRALPAISLRELTVDRVSDGVYRITVQVANDGFLPTLSAVGAMLGSPRKLRVDLGTQGQTIRGGRATQLLGAISGSGGAQKLSWIVVGAAGSRLTLTASSPAAGRSSRTLTLP